MNTVALLKETTDALRGLLSRGKETHDDGLRMILGPKGWRDTIDLIARADAELLEFSCAGCAQGLALCTDYTAGGVRKYHMASNGVAVMHTEK